MVVEVNESSIPSLAETRQSLRALEPCLNGSASEFVFFSVYYSKSQVNIKYRVFLSFVQSSTAIRRRRSPKKNAIL